MGLVFSNSLVVCAVWALTDYVHTEPIIPTITLAKSNLHKYVNLRMKCPFLFETVYSFCIIIFILRIGRTYVRHANCLEAIDVAVAMVVSLWCHNGIKYMTSCYGAVILIAPMVVPMRCYIRDKYSHVIRWSHTHAHTHARTTQNTRGLYPSQGHGIVKEEYTPHDTLFIIMP